MTCHPWCTHRIFLVVKNKVSSFSVTVDSSIKEAPLIFLLQMFVITENIMERPVCINRCIELKLIIPIIDVTTQSHV